MIKKILFRSIPICSIALIVMSYANTPPPEGNTGSPGDGQSCTSCHSGSPITKSDIIIHDIPAEGYEPGKTYNVEVKISKSTSSIFGFQFAAQKSDGSAIGTLAAGGASTKVSTSGKYISHAGNQVNGTGGSKTWAFTWTAPAANTGTINFYVAGNASNGNNRDTGDEIQVSSVEVLEKGVKTGINQVASYSGFRFYPNPTNGILNLESEGIGRVTIMNTIGESVLEKNIEKGNAQADLQDLESGVYIISYSNQKGVLSSQTLIKY